MTWTVPEATRNDNRVGSEGPSCGGPSLRTMAPRRLPTQAHGLRPQTAHRASQRECLRNAHCPYCQLPKDHERNHAGRNGATLPPPARIPGGTRMAVARTGKLAIESPLSEAQQATGVPSC